MAKCKGSKEDGSVCGRPTMYKSDFCKKHRSQDPSFTVCMGKQMIGEGKPCTREAMTGLLFCRAHRTQLADIEKLQCPRGCGQLHLRLSNNSMYFHCRKCKGALLDAKMLEIKLSERADMLNELLENGEECSLRCPRCEGLMLEIRVVYEMPKGGGGGFNPGGVDHPGALIGILLIVVVVAAISAAAESKKKRSEDENDEFTGPNMIIDGCRDCGTFWFDADEMKIVKQSLSLTGTTKEELASIEAEIVESVERKEEARVEGRSTNTHCLHIDKRNGKNCRRVTYRSTEYCYMHQPK